MKKLSREELQELLRQTGKYALEEAKKAGTYIVYGTRDGKIVREYPDGRKVVVEVEPTLSERKAILDHNSAIYVAIEEERLKHLEIMLKKRMSDEEIMYIFEWTERDLADAKRKLNIIKH